MFLAQASLVPLLAREIIKVDRLVPHAGSSRPGFGTNETKSSTEGNRGPLSEFL